MKYLQFDKYKSIPKLTNCRNNIEGTAENFVQCIVKNL